jgi:hypothetical protein
MARALWLPDVLSAAGLTVVTHPGWQSAGHEMDAIEGVVAHHTASPDRGTLASALGVITHGNTVAPGPIAQVLIWRDGVCHVVAAGKANHAGAGGPWGWLPESPPGRLSLANAHLIGIECANDGRGEHWPLVQVESLLTACAAILSHLGTGIFHALMHAEWAPTRKIDPAGPNPVVALRAGSLTWDGNSMRHHIAARMTAGRQLAAAPAPVVESPHPVAPFIPNFTPASAATLTSEDDDMPPIRVRFHGFKNVFLLTSGGYIHLTGALNDYFSNAPLVESEYHEQGVKSALAQSGLTMADLLPSGE